MSKKLISAALSLTMTATMCGGFAITANAAANTPQYQEKARQMEELNRGLVAAYRTSNGTDVTSDEAGVYLSWRLLGDEPLATQEFDIYKNDVKIATTTGAKGTNYIDTSGTASDSYKVVKQGASSAEVAAEPAVTPAENHVASGSGRSSLKQSMTYVDIPIVRPDPVERMGDGKLSYYYTYDSTHEGGANDASVGDLDGDGDYEIVLKWDPTDSKDSAGSDYTGNTYIDAYEIDPDNEGYMWRIDLGKNVTSGAHYTQFMVYDFDGDGKSEIAMKTAPGTKDGKGNYVSEVGDTEEIRNVDNTASFVGDGTNGPKGKNPYTQYMTVFDGETGAALWTTEYIPYDACGGWGDSKFNRSERYLAAVAYIDGVHPSIVMCRGYYAQAAIRVYSWDGNELKLQAEHYASSKSSDNLYGQGNHNLSVGDIDGDDRDEIVYGSAALDLTPNGDGTYTTKAVGNTGLGHGDAMHMSDFNNDGVQEVFSVKEDSPYYEQYGEDLRNPVTGEHFWESGKIAASDDNGRGVMDNIDDAYALAQHNAGNDNAMALGWSSGFSSTHDFNGDDVNTKPASAGNGSFDNFLVYWDGDLSRELLDANIIQKYDASTGYTTRFWGDGNGYTLTGGSTNNYTKRNPSLVADIWGDWREEIIMPINKGVDSDGNPLENPALRIFTSTIPTDYRLTTLMHDSQYRMSVAWQNVAYNQPTHQSYYIGSIALATDDSGNALNYLAPATAYSTLYYPEIIAVEGISMNKSEVTVGKGFTTQLTASLTPENATRKGRTWTSSNESVATVDSIGNVKGISEGKATITVISADGAFTDECTVTVLPTETADVTGDEVFATDNTDEASVLSNASATGASFAQNGAAVGGNFYRTFERYETNKATLSFTFGTGGNQNSSGAWNWEGREYTYYMSLLDGDDNIIELSQSHTTSAQPTQAKIGGGSAADVKSSWTAVGDTSNNPMNRSAATWNVTVELDYDNDEAAITVLNSDKTGGYTKTFSLDGKRFSKLEFSSTVDGAGGITWTPSVSNVTYTRTGVIEPTYGFELTATDDKTAKFEVTAAEDIDSVTVIGVLYDGDDIYQIKTAKLEDLDYAEAKRGSIEFSDTVDNYDMRLFLWDSLSGIKPLAGDIERKAGALSSINVVRSFGSTVIDQDVYDEIKPGETFSLPDTEKKDVTYNGKVYEYDPDNSDNTHNVAAMEFKTTVNLAYKLKKAPTADDTEIANIYINENGTCQGTAWTLPETNAEFKTDSDGIKYVEFTDDGTTPFAVTFDNTSDKLVVEFDMMLSDMTGGGDVFGAVPYSGDTKGNGVGFRRNGDGTQWEPAVTANNKYLTRVNSDDKYTATYQNKWIHVILVNSGGETKATFADLDGTVYVRDSWESTVEASTVGTTAAPVNKIVFGRGYGSGSGTMGIRNLKVYAPSSEVSAVTTSASVDVPGTLSLAPTFAHASAVDGVTYDASILIGDITYELRDSEGNKVTPEGLSLSDNGTLTADDTFTDTDAEYSAVVKLDGQDWYVYNLTFRGKTLISNTQEFTEGLNGFTITSGKTGYALEASDGTAKYTKTAGTANDDTVYITYPITTNNLGDEYEISFDIKVVSGSFKGYMYLVNGSGSELLKMETHLYEPRFKVPTTVDSAVTTVNFNSSNGFEYDKWLTVVYHYSDEAAKVDVYDKTDTERANPLVTTESYAMANTASNGVTFKMQVAQNIQNGSADKADEYYFDNFTYMYYDYE